MLRSVVLVALAVLLFSAQHRPNFSGEWVRIEPPPDLASVLTVVQDSESLTNQQIFPDPRSGTYRLKSGGVGPFSGPGRLIQVRAALLLPAPSDSADEGRVAGPQRRTNRGARTAQTSVVYTPGGLAARAPRPAGPGAAARAD